MGSDRLGVYLALLLYALPGLVAGFTLHELAHAATAAAFGDPTPRYQGRISLDPRQHIDPIGLTALLVLGFGWAKPVQFNPFYVRSRSQQALVAAAGPLTNLLLAVVFAVALHLELATSPDAALQACNPDELGVCHFAFGHGGAAGIVYWFLVQGFFVNVVLFVFNLLPIPGIDGFLVLRGVVGGVVPDLIRWMEVNRQYVWLGAIVVLFLLPQASGGTSNPLSTLVGNVDSFLYRHFVSSTGQAVGGLVSLLSVLSS